MQNLVKAVAEKFKDEQLWLTVAESCTGGSLAAAITDLPGSSAWFDRGFITYSNAAKHAMLGVDFATIEQYGAVSEMVVQEMAQGALNASQADLSIAISGVAGPGGGTVQKPVGTVWIAWASKSHVVAKKFQFTGDRQAIRQASVEAALQGVLAQPLTG